MAVSERVRVFRPAGSGRIEITVPYVRGMRDYLKEVGGGRARPDWDGARKVWTMAVVHTPAVLEFLLENFGRVELTTQHRVREMCTASCADADPDTSWGCECVCGGEHHGTGIPGGRYVSDGELQVGSGGTFTVVKILGR